MRGDVNHSDVIKRDADQLTMSNAKTYNQWIRQRALQEKYEEMERARMAQMEAEARAQEEAKMGIQAQINELNGYNMDTGSDEEEEEEANEHQYNPLRQKNY